jgi:ferredoxin
MASGHFLRRAALQTVLDALVARGYRVLGPVVDQGVIQFRDLDNVADLPQGVHDVQSPGSYRLVDGDTPRNFAWASGPQALKPLLFPPREVLWRAQRDDQGRLRFDATESPPLPLAVIGVRPCDLAALALNDSHFLDHTRDPGFAARRQGLFLIAVNCSHPADTCFCASTGDGPNVDRGADLILDELDDGFVVAADSDAGRDLLDAMALEPASQAQCDAVREQAGRALRSQTRRLPGRDLQGALFDRLDHQRWEDVGDRCLACGNCTSVCPTCFCHAQQDVPTLDGASSEHIREWDSCFSEGHAYLHGYPVRPEIKHRFRQWMTHKLGSWHAQFGRSGCVGCGRCITWCPVGIDITAEAAAICGHGEAP